MNGRPLPEDRTCPPGRKRLEAAALAERLDLDSRCFQSLPVESGFARHEHADLHTHCSLCEYELVERSLGSADAHRPHDVQHLLLGWTPPFDSGDHATLDSQSASASSARSWVNMAR